MALNDVKINREYDIFVRYLAEKRHEELAGKRGAERKAVLDKWAESGRIQKLRAQRRSFCNTFGTSAPSAFAALTTAIARGNALLPTTKWAIWVTTFGALRSPSVTTFEEGGGNEGKGI